MKRIAILLAIVAAALAGLAAGAGPQAWKDALPKAQALWQQAVVPGSLSASHAFLAGECGACHEPQRGVQRQLCVTCHSDTAALLQRKSTAFHAAVQTCTGCHLEHREGMRMPTTMDHGLLAASGERLRSGPSTSAVSMWRPEATPESALQCAACHASIDPHQEVFGPDCGACHGTTAWQVPEFVHPSFRSTACAECHLPPPSHTMEHFSMVSRRLSGQAKARLDQCFLCHDTTAWNDIWGKGRIKHH
jgi:hypothetical protein